MKIDNKIKSDDISPESNVVPYEDLSSKQARISGEKFPDVVLGICDSCHWCYTSSNRRGVIQKCPICNKEISQVPMRIDEVCIIEVDERRGITLRFERKLPLR
jgi:hypothetical protein